MGLGFWVVRGIRKKNIMFNPVCRRVPWIKALSSEEQGNGLRRVVAIDRAVECGSIKRGCDAVDGTKMVLCNGGIGHRRFVACLEFWKWEE